MLFAFNLISSYLANIFARIEIKKQLKEIKNGNTEGSVRIKEFEEINKIVSRGLKNRIDEEIATSNYKIVKKLQHDIQSPLTSLEYFFSEAKSSLSEDLRNVGKQSIERILDIVNSLKINDNHSLIKESTDSETVAIFPILKRIVSEKRNEFKKRSDISINLNSQNEHDYFVNIKKSDFYRTISNIINNSIEAKKTNQRISISVSTKRVGTEVIIKIQDNGVGISPKDLPNVFDYGKSYHKEKGSGIGLFQAKEYVESEHGTMTINSIPNKGTEVLIKLNTVTAPNWYQKNLRLKKKNIIVIDDDNSIFNLWKKRLSSKSLYLKHIKSSEEFDHWVNSNEDLSDFDFLFDLELLGSKYDGINLINKYSLQANSTLVTSHFMDKEIQSRCTNSNIKMIPKESVSTINIDVIEKIESISLPKEIVLIDDDKLVHDTWEMVGLNRGISVYCYYDIDTFLSESEEYSNETPIYIDSNLKNEIKGEIESEKIYKRGFENLHLSTGSRLDSLPNWIKSQQGKEFPLQ